MSWHWQTSSADKPYFGASFVPWALRNVFASPHSPRRLLAGVFTVHLLSE